MRNHQGELNAISEVAKALTQPVELPELLDAALKSIVTVIGPAEAGLVMLWDQSAGLFRAVASYGYDQEVLSNLGLRSGESIIGKVFDGGESRLLSDQNRVIESFRDLRVSNRAVLHPSLKTDALPRCMAVIPISVGDKKVGVLVLETVSSEYSFVEDDLPIIKTIAELIALTIDRTRLLDLADSVRADRQAEKMRSELLALLSHELRIPLTTIQGYSSALLIPEIDWSETKREEFLRLIDEECRHMQMMLRDILDSSLIDLDELVIVTQPIRLPNIAREVALELQRLTDSHQILIDFPQNFPILEADARWVKQVFRNIIENAIKYSPGGGLIVVRGEIRQMDIIIIIADQGIGISPEDQIPLFEKYFRAKSAATWLIPGTGLGLPISRKIVEAHGGRIWVESKVGEGTTVHFSLPLPMTSKET